MGTKSKKSRIYQTGWKFCAVFVLFISAFAIFICGVIFANVSDDWGKSILSEEDFYNTVEFQTEFYHALDSAILADVFYQSEAQIEAGEKVDREELLSGFKRYYSIIDGVITGNTQINDSYNGLIVYGVIPQTLQENFIEYEYLVETRLPQYRQMYIQNQLDDYRATVRSLETLKNFYYFVEDENGNLVAGNATRAEVNSKNHTIMLSAEFCSDNLAEKTQIEYSNYYLQNSPYRVYAAIDDPLQEGDVFYDLYQQFRLAKMSLPYLFSVSAIALLIFSMCLIYLLRVVGQKEKHGEIKYLFVDHIYNEIHLLLVFGFAAFSLFAALMLLRFILQEGIPFWSYVCITLLGILYMIDLAVGLSYILSLTRQIKGGILFRNTLVSVCLRKVASLFTGTTFRGWMILVMLAYGMGNCVLVFLMCLYWTSNYMLLIFIALLVFNVFCLYLFIRALRSLKRIMISARETSQGNFSYQLDLAEISPSFLNFAEDIANIQDGLKKAVEEAIKGERMKTELITNVSHDLKTPLTSIITYADLLKHQQLDNPVAQEYVEVLHVKSYRLKQLIEDLIEASKVSSGNIAVEKMRVDYRQLVMQAVGEMEEKLADAKLEFKLHCDAPILIDADGRHMWRILENILSNVVKYAMSGSRVYAEIYAKEGYGVLEMKNVSAAPIDFDAAHLTERFVRGDSARTTEGSGLGLSIAQSLAEVQGGHFDVQIDGDLFKAIVSIPLWMGEDPQSEQSEQFEQSAPSEIEATFPSDTQEKTI